MARRQTSWVTTSAWSLSKARPLLHNAAPYECPNGSRDKDRVRNSRPFMTRAASEAARHSGDSVAILGIHPRRSDWGR